MEPHVRVGLVKIMKYILAILITFVSTTTAFSAANAPGIYYVSPGTLNVRLAADKSGKRIKKINRQEQVEVFEIKGDWARISSYYNGTADGVPGKVAHWVAAKFLRSSQPAKRKKAQIKTTNIKSQVTMAIKLSDDFSKYRNAFVSASKKLINNGTCKLEEFKKLGGWWLSLKHKPEPVYVTYCGGTTDNNRIYLNAKTGSTFR